MSISDKDFAALLAALKPKFIRHPESKELIKADVGHLLPFPPPSQPLFSAPFSQLNWWVPICPVVPEDVMAFHPQYLGNPVLIELQKLQHDRGATTTTSGTGPAG